MAADQNINWNYQGYDSRSQNNLYNQHQLPPPPPPPPAYSINAQHNIPPAYPVNSCYGVPLQSQNQFQHVQHAQHAQHAQHIPPSTYYYNQHGQHTNYPASFPPPPPPPPPPAQAQAKQQTPSKKNKNQIINSTTTCTRPTTTTKSAKDIASIPTTTTTAQTYHCESCSITFQSKSALESHNSSHIKCSHPKCNFVGSKKVVSAHYSSKHGKFAGRGLKTVTIQTPGSRKLHKFKICVGNHPDDIEAWIKERKKRFPTRERQIKVEERKKRKREEGAIFARGQERGRGEEQIQQEKPQKEVLLEAKAKRICMATSDCAPAGMTKTVDSKILDSKTTQKESQDAFANLACYGSSSDDDDDNTDTPVIQNTADNIHIENNTNNTNSTNSNVESPVVGGDNKKFKTRHCRYFLRNGTCKNGDKCTYIHDNAEHEKYKLNRSSRCQMQSQKDKAKNEAQREMNILTTGRAQGMGSNGNILPSGRTLLRKLLQNDIHRERNLTLQLLRYIADCNYLQEKREEKK